jgi:hypothetical protein
VVSNPHAKRVYDGKETEFTFNIYFDNKHKDILSKDILNLVEEDNEREKFGLERVHENFLQRIANLSPNQLFILEQQTPESSYHDEGEYYYSNGPSGDGWFFGVYTNEEAEQAAQQELERQQADARAVKVALWKDGFDGVPWGISKVDASNYGIVQSSIVQELSDISINTSGYGFRNDVVYVRKGERDFLGAKAHFIRYEFDQNGKFVSVVIHMNSRNYDIVINKFMDEFENEEILKQGTSPMGWIFELFDAFGKKEILTIGYAKSNDELDISNRFVIQMHR